MPDRFGEELFIQGIAADDTIERHDAGRRQRSCDLNEIATLQLNVGRAATPHRLVGSCSCVRG
jgi:hypothetical protein